MIDHDRGLRMLREIRELAGSLIMVLADNEAEWPRYTRDLEDAQKSLSQFSWGLSILRSGND